MNQGERNKAIEKVLEEHRKHCAPGEFAYSLGCEPHNYGHTVGWMCDGCDDHNFLFDPLSEGHLPCEPWTTVKPCSSDTQSSNQKEER